MLRDSAPTRGCQGALSQGPGSEGGRAPVSIRNKLAWTIIYARVSKFLSSGLACQCQITIIKDRHTVMKHEV